VSREGGAVVVTDERWRVDRALLAYLAAQAAGGPAAAVWRARLAALDRWLDDGRERHARRAAALPR